MGEDIVTRFHTKYKTAPGCWAWTAGRYRRGGYGMVSLGRRQGRQRNTYAHRVAYVLAHGDIPPGMVVMHKCDNPPCVNPVHLSLGTQRDNLRDCVRKDRHVKARPWLHKLSDGDVQAIRMSRATHADMARCYGVSGPHISFIRSGQRRKPISRRTA